MPGDEVLEILTRSEPPLIVRQSLDGGATRRKRREIVGMGAPSSVARVDGDRARSIRVTGS
jgi:hypothetical protein